jgi:DeoR/GlpR family transcriptional regulator of sugar metabolism
MLAQQRQAAIVERVLADGGVRVAQLVAELGVSDMTIRRDLEMLAERGLIAKVHGGATAPVTGSTDEPGFVAKAALQLAEKGAIADAAAALVKPGTAIALSAGTTTAALAHRLVDVPRLTIITNSIPVADVFYRSDRGDQTVVLTGGVRTPSDALVGPVAVTAMRSLHVDMLFLGVHGMNEHAGFTTSNLMEAEINRALVASASQLIVVADHTKWGMTGVSSMAELDDATMLVTDSGLPSAVVKRLSERIETVIVGAP